MNILGISAPLSLNPAAVIVQDGRLLAAAEEERFNRIKYAPRMVPYHAIEFCLNHAGLTPPQVDAVAMGFRSPSSWLVRAAGQDLLWGDVPRAGRRFASFSEYLIQMKRLQRWMAEEEFDTSDRDFFRYVPHHLAHAASAYRCSGFQRANVLTLDGQGEDDAGYLGIGQDGDLDRLDRVPNHQSLGEVYGELTAHLGFEPHREEGKTMALAGLTDQEIDVSGTLENSSTGYRIRRGWREHLFDGIPPRDDRDGPLRPGHKQLAHAVQRWLENTGQALARQLHQRTGLSKLCLAGGVALNCDMNRRIRQVEGIDEVFIQPAAHDAGTALGAALQLAFELGEPADFQMDHAYWGPEATGEEIEAALETAGLAYERRGSAEKIAAEHLSEGRIVGLYQGRAEFGPRALGNRSILAHPGMEGMAERINDRVKHREPWRPFAPSVLHGAADRYFEDYHLAPFMIETFDVTAEAKKHLSQTIHVDGTARPQSVTQEANPRFHRLIQHFAEITGIPAVLNTSFNDREPMVLTPRDAIRCFASTGIDVLIMEDFMVEKSAMASKGGERRATS